MPKIQGVPVTARPAAFISGSAVPDGSIGYNGDTYRRQATGVDSLYGPKTSGAWGDPVDIRGADYSATSASSLSIANSGSKSFTTQARKAFAVGTRIRAASEADPTTNWMEGIVTSYSSTTLVVTMDLSAGSGTHTDWVISLAGARGATGATGATGPEWSPTPEAFIADPTGGATQDAEARTAINSILDVLIAHGLMAAS